MPCRSRGESGGAAGSLEVIKYQVKNALACGPLLHDTLQREAPREGGWSSSSWEHPQRWSTWDYSEWNWADQDWGHQREKKWEEEKRDDVASQSSWGSWTRDGKTKKQQWQDNDDQQDDEQWWQDHQWYEQTWQGYDWDWNEADQHEEVKQEEDKDDVISVPGSSEREASQSSSKRRQFFERTGYKRARGGKHQELL